MQKLGGEPSGATSRAQLADGWPRALRPEVAATYQLWENGVKLPPLIPIVVTTQQALWDALR